MPHLKTTVHEKYVILDKIVKKENLLIRFLFQAQAQMAAIQRNYSTDILQDKGSSNIYKIMEIIEKSPFFNYIY